MTNTMSTEQRYALAAVLAAAALIAGCSELFDESCPTDDMQSARTEADPLYRFGCADEDVCPGDDRVTCWDQAADAVSRDLGNGESFAVYRKTLPTPGGTPSSLWQVNSDGSGTYYHRGTVDDVVEPGEESSCSTSATEFDTIVRDHGQAVELRVDEDRWKTLPQLRAMEIRCGSAGPPVRFEGDWVDLIDAEFEDRIVSSDTAPSGDLLVGGHVTGSIGSQTYEGNGSDGLVAKYEPEGNRQWVRLIGGESEDRVHDVVTDGAGNVYAAGTTRSELTDGLLDAPTAFVAKFTPAGERVWLKLLENKDAATAARGLAIDDEPADGEPRVYVVGRADDEFVDQPHPGGLYDGFVTRMSTDGERAWTRLVGTDKDDLLEAVDVGPEGRVGVAGTTHGNFDGQSDDGDDVDGVAALFTPSGERQWLDKLTTTARDDATAIAIGTTSLYVGGTTEGPLGDNQRASSRNDTDGFIVAYDREGERRWLRLVAGDSDDRILGLAADGETLHAVGRTGDRLGRQNYSGRRVGFHAHLSTSGNTRSARFVPARNQLKFTDLAVGDTATYLVGVTRGIWDNQPFPEPNSAAALVTKFEDEQ